MICLKKLPASRHIYGLNVNENSIVMDPAMLLSQKFDFSVSQGNESTFRVELSIKIEFTDKSFDTNLAMLFALVLEVCHSLTQQES